MRRWSDIAEDLLLAAGLVVLFLVPHRISSDGAIRFQALSELLTNDTIPDSRYSMIGPLLSTPLWWLGSLFGSPEQACKHFNWLVLLVFIAASDCLLHADVERSLRRRIQLLFLAGSMFAAQQKDFLGEVVTVVGVLVGFLALHQGRWWGGLLMAFGAANVPASIPAAGLLVLYLMWQTRRLRYALIAFAMVGIVLLENTLRRGGPFRTGYESDHGVATMLPYSGQSGFSYPFGFGLLSILFSFGKGLVFFAPGLLLPVRSSDDPTIRAIRPWYIGSCIFTAGLVLTYSRWWAWYGGLCWGPRFFLAASVPASIALAIWLRGSRTAVGDVIGLGCLALSCWVGFCGAVCDQCDLATLSLSDNFAHEHLTWYVPEFSVLWRPLIARNTWSIRPGIAVVYWIAVSSWLAAPAMYRFASRMHMALPRISKSAFSPWRW